MEWVEIRIIISAPNKADSTCCHRKPILPKRVARLSSVSGAAIRRRRRRRMENADVFLGLHDFLERMRQPTAADFVKAIKRFYFTIINIRISFFPRFRLESLKFSVSVCYLQIAILLCLLICSNKWHVLSAFFLLIDFDVILWLSVYLLYLSIQHVNSFSEMHRGEDLDFDGF